MIHFDRVMMVRTIIFVRTCKLLHKWVVVAAPTLMSGVVACWVESECIPGVLVGVVVGSPTLMNGVVAFRVG